jgi:hypothetical protein
MSKIALYTCTLYTSIVLSNDATVSGYEHLVVTLGVQDPPVSGHSTALHRHTFCREGANPSSANFDWTNQSSEDREIIFDSFKERIEKSEKNLASG